MSFYRGDDVEDEYGNIYRDGINVGSDFNQQNALADNFIYEGPHRYVKGQASAYGSGLPSAGLVAAVLGIPAFSSFAPKSVNNAADRAERALTEWATTAGITTGSAATTTDSAATSVPSSPPPRTSSQPVPPSWEIIYPTTGLQPARARSVQASRLPPVPARPTSRAAPKSLRLSAKQRKLLLQEALHQALL